MRECSLMVVVHRTIEKFDEILGVVEITPKNRYIKHYKKKESVIQEIEAQNAPNAKYQYVNVAVEMNQKTGLKDLAYINGSKERYAFLDNTTNEKRKAATILSRVETRQGKLVGYVLYVGGNKPYVVVSVENAVKLHKEQDCISNSKLRSSVEGELLQSLKGEFEVLYLDEIHKTIGVHGGQGSEDISVKKTTANQDKKAVEQAKKSTKKPTPRKQDIIFWVLYFGVDYVEGAPDKNEKYVGVCVGGQDKGKLEQLLMQESSLVQERCRKLGASKAEQGYLSFQDKGEMYMASITYNKFVQLLEKHTKNMGVVWGNEEGLLSLSAIQYNEEKRLYSVGVQTSRHQEQVSGLECCVTLQLYDGGKRQEVVSEKSEIKDDVAARNLLKEYKATIFEDWKRISKTN